MALDHRHTNSAEPGPQNTILYISDISTDSDETVASASQLASMYDSEIEVIYIIDVTRAPSWPDAQMGFQHQVEKIGHTLTKIRNRIKVVLLFGSPEEVIQKRACERDVRLIAVGSGWGSLEAGRQRLVGSLSQKVSCPVVRLNTAKSNQSSMNAHPFPGKPEFRQAPALNLLIVDDEAAIRASLSNLFTMRGHHVRSASDALSALDEIRRRLPDVLLSDLKMPGMSGFDLLSKVSRQFPKVQVVAMSAVLSGRDMPPGFVADAFFAKGENNPEVLLELVERMAQPSRVTRPFPVQESEIEDGRLGQAASK